MLWLCQFLPTHPYSIYSITPQKCYSFGTFSYYSLNNNSAAVLFIFTLPSPSFFCLTMLLWSIILIYNNKNNRYGAPFILCIILSLLFMGPVLNRLEEGDQENFQKLIIKIPYYISQIAFILWFCSDLDVVFYNKGQLNLVCST